MKKFVLRVLYPFLRQMSANNVSSYAAAAAFFLFVSLLPIIYLTCTILPYIGVSEEALLILVEQSAPGTVGMFLKSLITDVYSTSTGVITASVIIMIWSAGKGMMAIMNGLNVVNRVPENRNYIVVRIISAFYTVIVVVAMLLSIIFMGFGKFIIKRVFGVIPGGMYMLDFLLHFRFLYAWIILALIFCLLYTYVPNKKLRLHRQIPGAVFSSVVWSVFSWGFSMYIEYFHGFSLYGSLATVIIVMLWLYFMCYIILIGAYINRFFSPAYKS